MQELYAANYLNISCLNINICAQDFELPQDLIKMRY